MLRHPSHSIFWILATRMAVALTAMVLLALAAAAAIVLLSSAAPATAPAPAPAPAPTTAAPGPSPKGGPLVGDPAPDLDVAEWLAGEPLAWPARGRVVVLDIWAPWCHPCVEGFAHLSELEERYAGKVAVVGLTGDDDYGSTLEKARDVLKRRSAEVRYRMAWDRNGTTYATWMKREQVMGWPWCFVVDRDGRIAWVGHPMQLDPVLERVVAGTWNRDSAAVVYRHRATGLDLGAAYAEAYRAGRNGDARTRYATLRGFDESYAADYAPHYFKQLLIKEQRPPEAYTFASEALTGMLRDRSGELRRIAELVADTTTPPASRNLDVTLAVARRAVEARTWSDPAALAALARIHALRGEWSDAVREQERAVAAADSNGMPGFKDALARYRAQRP